MLAKIYYVLDGYRYVFDELRDHRTKNFFLVRNPFEIIFVVALYLKFVSDWGPRFMKDREPFKLKEVLIVYNIFQVLFNAYMVIVAAKHTYIFGDYNFFCEPVDTSDSPVANLIVRLGYCYYLAKVIDLLDTIFFVLRKKQSQITFLHKFHHVTMCLITYIGLAYYPDMVEIEVPFFFHWVCEILVNIEGFDLNSGHGVLVALLNSFVHVVMYFYYLVTVLDKQGKYTWWKRYLTQLQIVQFGIIALHGLSLLIHPYCGYPKWTAVFGLPLNTTFMILFANFYYKTYIKKESKKES